MDELLARFRNALLIVLGMGVVFGVALKFAPKDRPPFDRAAYCYEVNHGMLAASIIDSSCDAYIQAATATPNKSR